MTKNQVAQLKLQIPQSSSSCICGKSPLILLFTGQRSALLNTMQRKLRENWFRGLFNEFQHCIFRQLSLSNSSPSGLTRVSEYNCYLLSLWYCFVKKHDMFNMCHNIEELNRSRKNLFNFLFQSNSRFSFYVSFGNL